MATIPLTRGLVAHVDDADIPRLSAMRWNARPAGRPPGNWYACSGRWDPERRQMRTIYMHRFLLGNPAGLQVDHANGDGLDNRRANLRICTQSQNNANAKGRVGASGFVGVYCSGRAFIAAIWVARKRIQLGRWDTAEEAARAYDEAAMHHFGEFASPNFPREA